MSLIRFTLLLGTAICTATPVLAGNEADAVRAQNGSAWSPPSPSAATARPMAAPAPGQPLAILRDGPPTTVKKPEPKKAAVDESALRYYASTGDSKRVASEVARLRAMHPHWTPPDDLFANQAGIDETPLWALYQAGRYEELTTEIERLKLEVEGYQPSNDLASKLSHAIARRDLIGASESADWERVIAVASETSGLLTCPEMDVLWRVAMAFHEVGELDQSVSVYRYILSSCSDPKERVATVQKASTHVPPDMLANLMAMGRRLPNGQSEFEALRLDLFRREIGEFASGKLQARPGDRELAAFEALVRSRRLGDDAVLLGWFHYAAKSHDIALRWFEQGHAWRPDPKAIEGQILALRELGRTAPALELARKHVGLSPEIRKAFVEIVSADIAPPGRPPLEPALLALVNDTVLSDRNALGAQSLGWYHYNREEVAEARTWFDRSMSYDPTSEAAVGLAVSAYRLDDRATASNLRKQYASRFPALANLTWLDARPRASGDGTRSVAGGGTSSAERAAFALHEAGRHREAAAQLDALALSRGTGSYNREIVRAWAHYNAGNFSTAREIFTRLDRMKTTRDTRHGSFLAESAERGFRTN